MKTLLSRAFGALSLSVIATGCGTSPRAEAAVPQLDGTAWVLHELPGRTLLPQTAATLQFEGDRLSGSDGCNRYRGRYSAAGGKFKVVPPLAGTQMACPPDVMAQARAVTEALTQAGAYDVVDGRLRLLAASGAPLAVFDAQSRELAGTQWRATGINNGRQAVVGLVEGSAITMDFGTDGRVSGSAGCNRYTAAYTAEGLSSVRFEPAATTRMACADPAVDSQERNFLAALATVASARMEGERLELRTAEGALAVALQRVTR
jgi:heat shock protein HslJ